MSLAPTLEVVLPAAVSVQVLSRVNPSPKEWKPRYLDHPGEIIHELLAGPTWRGMLRWGVFGSCEGHSSLVGCVFVPEERYWWTKRDYGRKQVGCIVYLADFGPRN
jgi:hypothetical protein